MKTFMRTYLFVLMALFIVSSVFAKEPGLKKKQIGIATYSVKGLESDIEGAFKSLQEDGYTVMEISNYNAREGNVAGYAMKDYAKLAEKYGMDIISSHARAKFDTEDVEGTLAAWGQVFDDHKALGVKYVVFPMNRWADNVEQMKVECDLMNKIGEEANKRGIKFGYHNHNMEFEKIAGTDQMIEDFLIANTDPDKVFFQMDVYWVTEGGQDPVAYLQKYPDRFRVLHIKDDYVIGESGRINFEAIFNQFYKNGYKDWFVEIEEYMTPEQKAEMQKMMAAMRERQRQAAEQQAQGGQQQAQGGQQAGQGDQPRRPMGPPQRTPEEEAERLKTSLDAIAKSAKYLEAAAYVK
jgi:sugar phosphate isomerase/epimerase